MVTVEQDQWERLVDLMGNPEWASWEIFKDPFVRAENWDVLKTYLDEWMRGWTVQDLFEAGQERRICFAPVLSMETMAQQEQLKARNFFVDVTHPKAGTLTHLGPPYQLKEPLVGHSPPGPPAGRA